MNWEKVVNSANFKRIVIFSYTRKAAQKQGFTTRILFWWEYRKLETICQKKVRPQYQEKPDKNLSQAGTYLQNNG